MVNQGKKKEAILWGIASFRSPYGTTEAGLLGFILHQLQIKHAKNQLNIFY
jgi:hypothetical protein